MPELDIAHPHIHSHMHPYTLTRLKWSYMYRPSADGYDFIRSVEIASFSESLQVQVRPCEILWDLVRSCEILSSEILWDLMRSCEILSFEILWDLMKLYEIISSMSPCANGTRTLAVVPEYKIPCLMGTEVHPVTLFKICWDLVRSCEIMWDLIIRDFVRSYDIIWDLKLWDLVRSYEIMWDHKCQILSNHIRPR